MAFWNRNKPSVESLGALSGQKLESTEKPKFDSAKAKQESLSFEGQGAEKPEFLDSYRNNIAAEAAQKAQATEGKVSKWLGSFSKRLDSWSASMKEHGQQREQASVARAADPAVRNEQSAVNARGNIDYNRVLSLNLNSPEQVQTKSGKIESLLAAADEAREYIPAKIAQAKENLGNRMSLANETMTQLHLTPRTEGERQVFAGVLENDAKAFQQRREGIASNLSELSEHQTESGTKITANVDANYLMQLIRQAEAAGVPVNIKNLEVGSPNGRLNNAEVPPMAKAA